jgi:hypothetical protein
MIHQILHRKLKIEQHHYHKKLGFNSGDPEMRAVPTNLITFTDIICCYFTMAITRKGENRDFRPTLPSLSSFNHKKFKVGHVMIMFREQFQDTTGVT